MKQKTISVKTLGGKWVSVSKTDYLKAMQGAKNTDDDVRFYGKAFIASSGQLDENGIEPVASENISITPDAILVTAIAASPLAPAFAYVAGASINVDIIKSNTGPATINVSNLGAKSILRNGAALAAGELEAGDKLKFTYDGTAFQTTTDESIAAAKNVKQVADSAAAAAAGGLTASIDISSAEILALFTTPKQLVASPGAGKYVEIIASSAVFTSGGAAYATNTNLVLQYTGGTSRIAIDAGATLTSAADKIAPFNIDGTEIKSNAALNATVQVGNPTGGNGTLKIKITYKIVTI